jgi:DNA polymerase-3 subunit alpha
MSEYCCTHLHSAIGSIRDSVLRIDQAVSRAKELGMTSLGLSDHGSLGANFKFYKECNKQGIKPVLGFEAYFVYDEEDKEKSFHLCLYAKNNVGLKNLYKISSFAYINYFYRKPRVTRELLFNNSEGIIVTSACMGGPISRAILDNDIDLAISRTKDFMKHFKDDFYLEVHNHGIEDETLSMNQIRNIANDLNCKIIAGTDAHMTLESDREIHNIYKQLSYGQVGKTNDDAFEGNGYHILSYEEMTQLFNQNEIDTTLEIADKCNISIKHNEYHLPKFDTGGMPVYEYIKDLAYKGLTRINKANDKEYIDRLEYELSIIHMGGLEDYFLIVSDIAGWCRKNDVPIGPGRGSSSGALLCFCLGITNIDPIKYGLQFGRMLNAGRLMQYKFLED